MPTTTPKEAATTIHQASNDTIHRIVFLPIFLDSLVHKNDPKSKKATSFSSRNGQILSQMSTPSMVKQIIHLNLISTKQPPPAKSTKIRLRVAASSF